MVIHYQEFPYEEVRRPSGDYFDTALEAAKAGYGRDQIWSVAEEDDVITYGPAHHWVNVIGYIATKETHDCETYYIEDNRDEFDRAEVGN